MNPYFQELYFKKHSLNTLPHVKLKDLDRLESGAYESQMRALLADAVPVDHAAFADPCDAKPFESHFPAASLKRHKPRVLFISMKHEGDFETWYSLAKCMRVWDLDVRGVHKSSWRFYVKTTPFIVVGAPASPYSVYKPDHITTVFIPRVAKPT